jgi:hypothetical protein
MEGKTMKSDRNARGPAGAALSLGARLAQRQSRQNAHPLQLEIEDVLDKSAPAERGNDPYNTSGSFDRTKNWARVGKR